MDFASAYVVFESNERARGICLTNMGVIYFWNHEYLKASESFRTAAESAHKLIDKSKELNDKS